MKLHLWMCKYSVKILFIIITTTVFCIYVYIVVVPMPQDSYQQRRDYSEMQSVHFCAEAVATVLRGKA